MVGPIIAMNRRASADAVASPSATGWLAGAQPKPKPQAASQQTGREAAAGLFEAEEPGRALLLRRAASRPPGHALGQASGNYPGPAATTQAQRQLPRPSGNYP
ncbi:MAG TPA: hypothetical protein VNW50_08245, partial [Streptosporangiaceae bacterium]|nr:hypothetical protein [Streptosporangiaceae bacterium]